MLRPNDKREIRGSEHGRAMLVSSVREQGFKICGIESARGFARELNDEILTDLGDFPKVIDDDVRSVALETSLESVLEIIRYAVEYGDRWSCDS